MASASGAWAACSNISFDALTQAATFVKTLEQNHTGGLKNNMWVTFVDETGKVCSIVNTAGPGQNSGATWGVSRVISVQKANTSALLSLDVTNPGGVQAWASGALFLATQPVIDTNTAKVAHNQAEGLAGTLWGVQFSNLLNPAPAYAGSPNQYGTKNDPLKNKRVGGMIVFGGGLPLYTTNGQKIGAIGVSGDTSCTDQAFAWRVREKLASNLGIANAEQIAAKNGLGKEAEQLDISAGSYPDCIKEITPREGIVNGLK
jgi:hypothetical protein